MSMPFYVSPEQVMKDKADYARKGIARGRSGVVIQYAGGILFVAPNPSRALHKISEIYDRIAFAAVGRYNEYENLRKAGVTYADVTGYQFDRRDVTARGIANWYAQQLGTIFTESSKPFEVEIIVAEAGESADADQIYRITFDGSVGDEHGFAAIGGQADQVATVLKERYSDGMTLSEALSAAMAALAAPGNGERPDIGTSQLEVAVLDRTRPHRTFRRLQGARLEQLLAESRASASVSAEPAESADAGTDAAATGPATGPAAPPSSADPIGPPAPADGNPAPGKRPLRPAILIARVVASTLQTLVSMVVVFGIAFAVGFRSNATVLEWLGAAGLLALITFALAWLGLAFGLAAKTVASASNGPFPLILLPLVGSGIVPTSTMPTGLRYFAEYQPFTPMINTLRGLLLGTSIGWSWLIALAWCAGLGLLGLIWSISVFNRRDRKRSVPGPGFPGSPGTVSPGVSPSRGPALSAAARPSGSGSW